MPNYRFLLVSNFLLIGGLAVLAVMAFQRSGSDSVSNTESGSTVQAKAYSLDRDFSFCGEKFPMNNWDVRQRLDAELLRNVYFHSQTLLVIKRANAVFPVIEPVLKEEGVPDDLKYLAVIESNLSNAISPAGARGYWQFMKDAAALYNLEVSTEVDERYHLEKATRAACKYMRREKERLGSWILAAAAYNGGPERIRTEKEKQRAKTFFDMNLAADETMRYPFRIAAVKEIMEHPERYDYNLSSSDLYPPMPAYRTVKVDGPVTSWADFAVKEGTSYRMLKLYNPWLMDSKLTNKLKKQYEIRVPK